MDNPAEGEGVRNAGTTRPTRRRSREYNREYREANQEEFCGSTARTTRRSCQGVWSPVPRGQYPSKVRETETPVSNAANPEKGQEHSRRRRARKLGQLGTVTPGIKRKLWERQGRRCAGPGCGKQIKLAEAELDHYVAVTNGGLDDDANFQVLCVPCNRSKHARDPLDFAASRGFLL